MYRRGMGQGMRPGMGQGPMRPGMQANPRANMMRNRANVGGGFRGGPAGGFHGGPGAGFRGPQGGGMEAGLRIGPAGTWWKNPTVVQRLGLTPDQTKKMDDIFQQSRLQLIDLKANVEKQNALLEPLLNANPVDTAKASAQIDKVAQARADLEKADAKMLLGIRAMLTPDQWTKLHNRAGGPGAPGQGGPGGPAAQNDFGPYGEGGYGAGRGPARYGASDMIAPPPQP
jgi:Spy/CpxP family protein refolding chaperone